MKFLQKQREKKSGLPAIISAAGEGGHQQSNNGGGGLVSKAMVDKNNNINNNEGGGGGDAEKDELVLQDTFAQETAVMVEDPNMYVKIKLPSSLVMHFFFFYAFSSFFLNFVISHPMFLNEIK